MLVSCAHQHHTDSADDKIIVNIESVEFIKENYNPITDIIIDVRSYDEFMKEHAKNSYNISVLESDFEQRILNLDKSKKYFLYCRTGKRSEKAKLIMKKNGFNHVYNTGTYENIVNAGIKETKY